MIQYPAPPDVPQFAPGNLEAFLGLFIIFWLFSFLTLLVLPRRWSTAVLRTAFPCFPRRDREE